MNVIAWFVLSQLIVLGACVWVLYDMRMLIVALEDIQNTTHGRMNNLLEKCLELKEKLKHDK